MSNDVATVGSIKSEVSPSVGEAAERYAELGWPVCHLVPRTKIPFAGSHGVNDATVISLRYGVVEMVPNANLAVVPSRSLQVVLDVDLRNGGEKVLEALRNKYGHEMEEWPIVLCGDGVHSTGRTTLQGRYNCLTKPKLPRAEECGVELFRATTRRLMYLCRHHCTKVALPTSGPPKATAGHGMINGDSDPLRLTSPRQFDHAYKWKKRPSLVLPASTCGRLAFRHCSMRPVIWTLHRTS